MRFNNYRINRNDNRLFPFVGGLVLGGVTGAAIGNSRPNYNPYYNYPYYYQNPYYYPNYIYNQNMTPPQVNIYNPYVADKVIYEDPTPLILTQDDRNISNKSYESIKNVPIMNQNNSNK